MMATMLDPQQKSVRRSTAYTLDQVQELLDLFPEASHLSGRLQRGDNIESLFQDTLDFLAQVMGGSQNVVKEFLVRKTRRKLHDEKAVQRAKRKKAGVRFQDDEQRAIEYLEAQALQKAGIEKKSLEQVAAAPFRTMDKVNALSHGLLTVTMEEQRRRHRRIRANVKERSVVPEKNTSPPRMRHVLSPELVERREDASTSSRSLTSARKSHFVYPSRHHPSNSDSHSRQGSSSTGRQSRDENVPTIYEPLLLHNHNDNHREQFHFVRQVQQQIPHNVGKPTYHDVGTVSDQASCGDLDKIHGYYQGDYNLDHDDRGGYNLPNIQSRSRQLSPAKSNTSTRFQKQLHPIRIEDISSARGDNSTQQKTAATVGSRSIGQDSSFGSEASSSAFWQHQASLGKSTSTTTMSSLHYIDPKNFKKTNQYPHIPQQYFDLSESYDESSEGNNNNAVAEDYSADNDEDEDDVRHYQQDPMPAPSSGESETSNNDQVRIRPHTPTSSSDSSVVVIEREPGSPDWPIDVQQSHYTGESRASSFSTFKGLSMSTSFEVAQRALQEVAARPSHSDLNMQNYEPRKIMSHTSGPPPNENIYKITQAASAPSLPYRKPSHGTFLASSVTQSASEEVSSPRLRMSGARTVLSPVSERDSESQSSSTLRQSSTENFAPSDEDESTEPEVLAVSSIRRIGDPPSPMQSPLASTVASSVEISQIQSQSSTSPKRHPSLPRLNILNWSSASKPPRSFSPMAMRAMRSSRPLIDSLSAVSSRDNLASNASSFDDTIISSIKESSRKVTGLENISANNYQRSDPPAARAFASTSECHHPDTGANADRDDRAKVDRGDRAKVDPDDRAKLDPDQIVARGSTMRHFKAKEKPLGKGRNLKVKPVHPELFDSRHAKCTGNKFGLDAISEDDPRNQLIEPQYASLLRNKSASPPNIQEHKWQQTTSFIENEKEKGTTTEVLSPQLSKNETKMLESQQFIVDLQDSLSSITGNYGFVKRSSESLNGVHVIIKRQEQLEKRQHDLMQKFLQKDELPGEGINDRDLYESDRGRQIGGKFQLKPRVQDATEAVEPCMEYFVQESSNRMFETEERGISNGRGEMDTILRAASSGEDEASLKEALLMTKPSMKTNTTTGSVYSEGVSDIDSIGECSTTSNLSVSSDVYMKQRSHPGTNRERFYYYKARGNYAYKSFGALQPKHQYGSRSVGSYSSWDTATIDKESLLRTISSEELEKMRSFITSDCPTDEVSRQASLVSADSTAIEDIIQRCQEKLRTHRNARQQAAHQRVERCREKLREREAYHKQHQWPS